MMKNSLIIIGLVFITALSGYFSRHLTVDNSHWLPADDPVEILSNYVSEKFDQSEELILAVHLGKSFFSSDILGSLTKLEDDLKQALPNDEIRHPLNISFLLKNPSGGIDVTNLKKPWQKGQLSLKKMQTIFSQSYYHGRYISEDATSFLIIIRPQLTGNSLEKERKRATVHDTVLEKIQNYPLFSRVKVAGEIKLNHELNIQNMAELQRLLPLVFLIMMILPGIRYANLAAAFIVTFSALSSSLGSFAIFALLDIPLNILTSIVPILVMAIAVSDSIHIIDRYAHQQDKNLAKLIQFTWKPCLITSLTTAAGFASFYSSSLVSIKQIAKVGPLSILLAYLLIVASNWSLLHLLRPNISSGKQWLKDFFGSLQFKKIPGISLVLIPSLAIGIFTIHAMARTETNLLDSFFQKDAPIQQDFAWIDRHHGGSGSFDIIIGREKGWDFKNIDAYRSILQLKDTINNVEGVERVESYAMPVSMTHQKLSNKGRHPDSTEALAQELLFLEFSQNAQSADILRPFLSFNGKSARLVLRTKNLSNHHAEKIKGRLEQSLQSFPMEKEFSGNNEYFLRLGKLILDTQLLSLLITLGTIFALVILFYNIKTSAVATLINLLPICLVMLSIAITGTPFDFSTVLIAGVCMGISIDNSIHLLHYLSNPGPGGPHQAFQNGLRPVTVVSALFLLVFALFATSDIVLLQRFGIFSAAMVISSLAANMLLVPALWGEEKPKNTVFFR